MPVGLHPLSPICKAMWEAGERVKTGNEIRIQLLPEYFVCFHCFYNFIPSKREEERFVK